MRNKKGEQYIGKIKSIDKHEREKYIPFDNYTYTITVKVDVKGKLRTLTVGNFSKDPGKYFQINDKCKVYRYKNKLYTQFLYSKKLSDEDRKNNARANYRDSYLIIPPIEFSYADSGDIVKRLDAIISICAPVTYDTRYFPLYERVFQYLEDVEKIYSQDDEKLVRNEVKELITNIISERAYDAEIESIQINIKNVKLQTR